MIHSQRLSRSRGKDRGVGDPSTFRRPTRKGIPVVGNKTSTTAQQSYQVICMGLTCQAADMGLLRILT